MNRRRTAQAGFTLIEVVAVSVVAGVLAAAAAISLSAMERARSERIGWTLERDVSYARERAIATGLRHWVVFDVPASSYAVLVEDPGTPGRAGATPVRDPSTQAPLIRRTRGAGLGDARIVSAPFGDGSEMGFDRLGRPILADLSALSDGGTVLLSTGTTIVIGPGGLVQRGSAFAR